MENDSKTFRQDVSVGKEEERQALILKARNAATASADRSTISSMNGSARRKNS